MSIKKETNLNYRKDWIMSSKGSISIPIPPTPITYPSPEESGEMEEMRVKTLNMLNLMKGSQASRFIADTEPESKKFPVITEDADDDYFFFDIDTDCESDSYSSDLYHESDRNNSLSSDDFEPVKMNYQIIRNPSTQTTVFSDVDDQAVEEMFFMEL